MLLEIKDLHINFETPAGIVRAVDGVDLSIDQSGTVALVGESGCGKSVSALSILKLLPVPPAKINAKSISWKGADILNSSPDKMRSIRGKEIGFIFQEPLTSFNPVQKIGKQVLEALTIHQNVTEAEGKERVISALNRVGIRGPERVYEAYPFELSGGMRQRAMIAMALICQPDLIIADEPTTALDVTIQAQILELLEELQAAEKLAVMLITHNLGIVAEMVKKVLIMYAGRMAEFADTAALFKNPLHPYTAGLLESIPRPDRKGKLYAIPGMIPDPLKLPGGCYFHPRCPKAMDVCRVQTPLWKEVKPGHYTACWLY